MYSIYNCDPLYDLQKYYPITSSPGRNKWHFHKLCRKYLWAMVGAGKKPFTYSKDPCLKIDNMLPFAAHTLKLEQNRPLAWLLCKVNMQIHEAFYLFHKKSLSGDQKSLILQNPPPKK